MTPLWSSGAGSTGSTTTCSGGLRNAPFEDYGFHGVSVFVALDGAVARLCAEVDEVRRLGQIRLSTVGRLRQAGFTLLSTGRTPHFDVALPDLTGTTLGHLRAAFGPPTANPGRVT